MHVSNYISSFLLEKGVKNKTAHEISNFYLLLQCASRVSLAVLHVSIWCNCSCKSVYILRNHD